MCHSSHELKPSNKSTYDFICKNCGATDRDGDDILNKPCPRPKNED